MAWPLDARFKTPENAAIVSFLERANPSAHDEAASALIGAAEGLPDVSRYCPDVHAYAYVVLHTRERRIFAIAFGMSAVAFALAPEDALTAVQSGGVRYPEIGPDWVRFDLYADLRTWCKRAHDHAVRPRTTRKLR